MREINPQVWFGERELKHVPPHFIKCPTPVTTESVMWVTSRLSGRFSLSTYSEQELFFLDINNYIYFENPSEATIYELRWAGSENNSDLF